MDLQSRAESSPFYEIVASSEFAEQFARLVSDQKTRDEIQFSFESELPLDPDKFEKIAGTRVRRAIINCFPPLRIFFSISERTITLLQIHPLLEELMPSAAVQNAQS